MRRILLVCCLAVSAVFAAVTTPWASTPPCCAPVPPGIESWWPGEPETDPGTAGDTIDLITGWHGIMTNGATYDAGKVGQAWSFDGVDDHVVIPDAPTLYPGLGPMTIDAWIRTTTGGVVAQHYECGGDCTGNPE